MEKDHVIFLCAGVNTIPPNPDGLRFHLKLGFKIVHPHLEFQPGRFGDFMIKECIPLIDIK